jgi:predicted nucleic acid-binding protein
MASIIVWDSNIFAKLLFEEPDSATARDFISACMEREDITVIVPELFTYELANITQYYDGDVTQTIAAIEAPLSSNMISVSPNQQAWVLAEKIVRSGHKKSGYPSMYDSIYHALAIQSDGVFVTADKKHFAKSKDFQHICLLQNWQSLFDNT